MHKFSPIFNYTVHNIVKPIKNANYVLQRTSRLNDTYLPVLNHKKNIANYLFHID